MRFRGLNMLALVAALGTAGQAAADSVTLRLAHHIPEDHSTNRHFLEPFVEYVAELSGGDMTVLNFPGGQLGQQLDLLEGIALGTVDMTFADSGMLANYDEAIGILDLPFLFDSLDHANRTMEQGLLEAISERVVAAAPFESLVIFPAAFRHTLLREGSISGLEDMSGMSLRASQAPVIVETLRSFGAIPTPLPSGEIYTALQTGTVDGVESNKEFLYAIGAHEVAQTLVETSHALTFVTLNIGEVSLGRLSPEQTAIVREAAQMAMARYNSIVGDIEDEFTSRMEEAGVEIVMLDLDPFRDAVTDMRANFIDQMGIQDLIEIVDAAR